MPKIYVIFRNNFVILSNKLATICKFRQQNIDEQETVIFSNYYVNLGNN
jgi:hypothetical protein